jgi:hypothetical protein
LYSPLSCASNTLQNRSLSFFSGKWIFFIKKSKMKKKLLLFLFVCLSFIVDAQTNDLILREKFLTTKNKSISANRGDSLALVQLYESTQGDYWFYRTHWLRTNVVYWYGIKLDSTGRVVEINLSSNRLKGFIPVDFFKMTELRHLDLSSNELCGDIPLTLGSLTKLDYLDLSSNELCGNIPLTIGSLTKLDYLDLSSNKFEGRIPKGVWNLSALRTLNLSSNKLNGYIDSRIRNLNNLQYLYLNKNFLFDTMPQSICYLTNLIELNLSDNRLSGRIPNQIGLLKSLKKLDLSHNRFTIVPSGLDSLYTLNSLYLNNNMIDSLPPTFKNLAGIHSGDVSHNYLRFRFVNSIDGSVFRYSPQAKIGRVHFYTLRNGDSVIIKYKTNSEDLFSTFDWYKDGTAMKRYNNYLYLYNFNRDLDAGTYVAKMKDVHNKLELTTENYYVDVDPIKYRVGVLSNMQYSAISEEGGIYDDGDTVRLRAYSVKGFKFEYWTQDGFMVSSDSVFSFIVNRDTSFMANYIKLASILPKIEEREIRVFPNPTSGELHIGFDNEARYVKIYNYYGQIVYQDRYREEVNLSFLNTGIYLLRLYDNDFRVIGMAKIVISK